MLITLMEVFIGHHGEMDIFIVCYISHSRECLAAGRIRVHDAFGYWPVRSYRASEESARAYVELYRAYGGGRQSE